ncbi:MAG TPA: enoyl-CoA hydratase [Acidimicrobiales bacterium]|nr:enoyl-CoA hydratase [Acidimicrobiales bacterium]
MAIHVERRDAVRLLTIDRQERRNAVDAAALEELASAVADAEDARALVLTGAGGHFCAGADLTGLEDEGFASHLRQVLEALRSAPLPTIAAVEGAALGAGTQLAIACDLRVAVPTAVFGIPAAKLGLMVDHWTVRRLATVAGHGPARAMLLAAETLSGEDAHRLGLVQRLGDPQAALAWASEIAALAPLTIAGHKVSLNALEEQDDGGPEVAAAFTRAWSSTDLAEGRAAFAERRPPRFTGT